MFTLSPPPEPDYTDLSEDEATLQLRAYNDAYYDYQFQRDWLRLAVSDQEYAQMCNYQVSMLVDLYPWIAEYGPQGEVWHGLLLQLEATLAAAGAGDDAALTVINDFVVTYGQRDIFKQAMTTAVEMTLTPQVLAMSNYIETPTAWDAAWHICDATYRGDQLLVEIDTIPEPLVVRVVEHVTWRAPLTRYTRDYVSRALNSFSALVLVADVMTGFAAFADVQAVHAAFLASAGWGKRA